MTPEQLMGVFALLGDLRNQLAQVTVERDQLLELVRARAQAEGVTPQTAEA